MWRRGGPVALVTPPAISPSTSCRGRFRLESVHPGHTLEEVRDNTGFAFEVSDRVATTKLPDAATLDELRGPVARELAEIYPKFAAEIFGIAEKVRA